MSRTRKLLTQITQVCQEICDIKGIHSIKKNHSPLGTGRMNKEPLPDKYEKDERGYTRSMGNKKHAHCGDPHNSPDTRTHHEIPSPLSTLPPSSLSRTGIFHILFALFFLTLTNTILQI